MSFIKYLWPEKPPRPKYNTQGMRERNKICKWEKEQINDKKKIKMNKLIAHVV